MLCELCRAIQLSPPRSSALAWTSNWLDGERRPVQLLLLGPMFASLLMSTSIAAAFGDRAGLFAIGYLAIQIGRTAFVGTVALWRRYFDRSEEIGANAVGDELAIAHPDDPSTASAAVLIFGGPAIFLLSQLAFMRRATGQVPRSRALACAALVVLGTVTTPLSLLAAILASSAIPVAVALADTRAAPSSGTAVP